MSERPRCLCILCQLEQKLLVQLNQSIAQENYAVLYAAVPSFANFPRPSLLLARLRASRADASSDELLGELARWQSVFRDGLVQNLFLLAFLPLLHAVASATVRRYPSLEPDDAAQQALLVFLQFLASDEFRRRESHLAFAIARKVRRRTLEWASRETLSLNGIMKSWVDADSTPSDDGLEQHLLLRDFLHRVSQRGNIDGIEINLLIHVKLDGEPGDSFSEQLGLSPNAFRQRLKRLRAKLRRLAQTPPRGGEGAT